MVAVRIAQLRGWDVCVHSQAVVSITTVSCHAAGFKKLSLHDLFWARHFPQEQSIVRRNAVKASLLKIWMEQGARTGFYGGMFSRLLVG